MSNQPRFEVFPELGDFPGDPHRDRAPTGQFTWHFQDANGKLTHIGGEPFTRREDAHRAICGVVADHLSLVMGMAFPTKVIDPQRLPIVDLDEDGHVLAMTTAYERAASDRMKAEAGS